MAALVSRQKYWHLVEVMDSPIDGAIRAASGVLAARPGYKGLEELNKKILNCEQIEDDVW